MTRSPVVSEDPDKEKIGEEQEKQPVGVRERAAARLGGGAGRILRESGQGRASTPWRQSFKRGNRPALFELELERLAEEGEDPLGVQPGGGAGLTDVSCAVMCGASISCNIESVHDTRSHGVQCGLYVFTGSRRFCISRTHRLARIAM